LQDFLKQGLSFPAARSSAAESYQKQELALLNQPNNILGIEYCRALLRRRSPIRPITLPRSSSGYHDLTLDVPLASASAIRTALLEQAQLSQKICAQLPKTSQELLARTLRTSGFLTFDDFSSVLFHQLLSLSKEDLTTYQDITEDLAARMENCRFQFTTASAFADLLKTRQLTHTRITRALCHILLDLRQKDLETLRHQDYPVYANVLGFRKSAAPLLSAIKQKGTWPLLVKTADASRLLTPEQLSLFSQDVFAAHVYEAAKVCRFGTSFTHEYTRSPVILP